MIFCVGRVYIYNIYIYIYVYIYIYIYTFIPFIPTTVFKHSRKGKPFDSLYIDNMQTRNYALYHVLENIFPGKIGIKV